MSNNSLRSSRFILTKERSFFFFPDEGFDYIEILDFDIKIIPKKEDELMLQISRINSNGSTTINKGDTMSIEEFRRKYYSRRNRDTIQKGASQQIVLSIGVYDTNREFISLDRLLHTNNIEDFRIDIGFSLENYSSVF